MSLLKVIHYPNPTLSKKAEAVERITQKEERLIQDMIDTMHQEDGVGLAAPQVGISKRIIVISPNAKPGEERALINPEILERFGGEEMGLEGCLSLPGISGEVRRAKKIKFQARTLKNEKITELATDFAARVIQHEIDHLNGILLIDRVDFDRRQALLSEYQRL